MIIEQAIVMRSDGKRAEILLRRDSACGGCELNRGCGTAALGRLLGHRSKPLTIETGEELKAGDRLVLGLSEAALVRSSLLVYGMPLFGLVAGGCVAVLLEAAEILVVASSAAGFFAGFKFASRRLGALETDSLTPYIVDIQVNPETATGS